MRGGFVHNRVLVERLDAAFRAVGARTRLEYPIGPGTPSGFVDILATKDGVRVVCEAELRARRVEHALRKAVQLDADYLLVVTANGRTARAIRARLARAGLLPGVETPRQFILTLGQALQWVTNCFPLLTATNGPPPAKERSSCRGS
jgi:hypothetical protein